MPLSVGREQKVAMKDFSSEVRASMDVSHFIKQAQLLLDVDETSVEGVLDRMLKALLDQEPLATAEEAKATLFVKDSGEPRAQVTRSEPIHQSYI